MSVYRFADAEPFVCYQITDCHLVAEPDGSYQGINPFNHLRTLLSQLAPYPIILTGDLTQDHSKGSYELLRQLLADWPAPVFYLPGNHDDERLMAEVFQAAPFVAAKEVWAAGWQLLLLSTKGDTPAGSFPLAKQQALISRLQAEPLMPAWLFCHHHPKAIGSSIDEHGLVESEEFCQLLTHFKKVRGLAHGHCHHAYQSSHQHWQIVGCPASSVQFKLAPTWQTFSAGPQACLWRFSAGMQVEWEFIRV